MPGGNDRGASGGVEPGSSSRRRAPERSACCVAGSIRSSPALVIMRVNAIRPSSATLASGARMASRRCVRLVGRGLRPIPETGEQAGPVSGLDDGVGDVGVVPCPVGADDQQVAQQLEHVGEVEPAEQGGQDGAARVLGQAVGDAVGVGVDGVADAVGGLDGEFVEQAAPDRVAQRGRRQGQLAQFATAGRVSGNQQGMDGDLASGRVLGDGLPGFSRCGVVRHMISQPCWDPRDPLLRGSCEGL
jgi:hypothetical protein